MGPVDADLLKLSIATGLDLTLEGNLIDQLDKLIAHCNGCSEELNKLMDLVKEDIS